MRKRLYRSLSVKSVNVVEMLGRLAEGPVWVGMDVGKEAVFVVVRDQAGSFERPWKVKQPEEIGELVGQLVALSRERPLKVALEPTGTYGDALRQALGNAGLSVHRVAGKASKDYSEVFDGVPSNHDGKDAAIVAELAAIGKGRPWPWQSPSAWEGELEGQVEWLNTQEEILQLWLGRLEGLLSRHWPEATRVLKLNSATLLQALVYYGGPARLAADGDAAIRLRRWGGTHLRMEKIQRLLGSAQHTVGVQTTAEVERRMKRFAEAALDARREIRSSKQALGKMAQQNATLMQMAEFLGPATACVLWVAVGDPRKYTCGAAYRKAMGLNLKVRSSGKYQGKLKITKRGSSMGRRWLFFAAMRYVQEEPVRAWFQAKKRKDQDRALGAIVAVMRKLALAIYAVVTRKEPFDLRRLLPGRAWRRVDRLAAVPLGAPPPNPRDLSLSCQARRKPEKGRRLSDEPRRPSVLAPEAALGSVPTGALSSAQSKQDIAQ